MKASRLGPPQRVPDDHVAVVANMFTIREVDLKDSRNFLGSANMHAIAEAHGKHFGTIAAKLAK